VHIVPTCTVGVDFHLDQELGFPYNCFNYLPVTIHPPRCTRPHPPPFQRVPCSHSFPYPKDNGLCKTDLRVSTDGTLLTRFRLPTKLNPRLFVSVLLKGCHPALSEIHICSVKNYNSSLMETRHKVLSTAIHLNI